MEHPLAILTASGRAALAAAIKEQTLHLAMGEGDPLWDTTKSTSAAFDEAGVIELGFTHLADIRVTSLDEQAESLLDVDYSANAREGVIRRLPASSIPEGGEVTVHFKIEHPPEPIGQTALLREVGRRVVNEVHFVAADPEGEIGVPTGRYRLSESPTNHLFIRVRFDFEDAATSVVREQGLFVSTQTDPALPIGQMCIEHAMGTIIKPQFQGEIVLGQNANDGFHIASSAQRINREKRLSVDRHCSHGQPRFL